jgi:predicted component of type VI protein secretion system
MQYLLERLASAGERTPGPQPRFDLRAAVREQIQRVVSSHFWPGSPGLELMGLNLPPVAGYGYACGPDVARYSAGIRELVLTHEPRLADVQVSVAPTCSPLMPFQVVVSGQLADRDVQDTFSFDLPRRS